MPAPGLAEVRTRFTRIQPDGSSGETDWMANPRSCASLSGTSIGWPWSRVPKPDEDEPAGEGVERGRLVLVLVDRVDPAVGAGVEALDPAGQAERLAAPTSGSTWNEIANSACGETIRRTRAGGPATPPLAICGGAGNSIWKSLTSATRFPWASAPKSGGAVGRFTRIAATFGLFAACAVSTARR